MNAISITRNKIATSTEVVTQAHFGTNFVFDYERIGNQPWEKFDEVIILTGSRDVRYTGGSGSENIFDILNPDAIKFTTSEGVTRQLTSLTDFFAFTSQLDITPSIIIPVSKFLTDGTVGGHRDFDPKWSTAIKDFVKLCLETSGPSAISLFEIGNEYESFMSSLEYGRVASSVSLLVQQAINEYRLKNKVSFTWEEPGIAVQVWSDSVGEQLTMNQLVARNRVVMSEFNALEAAAVDAVVSHLYYTPGRHSGMANEHSYTNIDNIIGFISDLMGEWKGGKFGDIDKIISEWNVNHHAMTSIGLAQVSTLISMFHSFVSNGVDHMNFWSTMYHATSLASNSADLMAAGEIFKIMSSSLVGSSPIEIDYSQGSVDLTGFQIGNSITLFASNVANRNAPISWDFEDFAGGYRVVSASIIGVDASSSDGIYRQLSNLPAYLDPDANIVTSQIPTQSLAGKDSVTFQLGAYEVAVLELTWGGVARAKTDAEIFGTDAADVISTSNETTLVVAGGGNDRIKGGLAADVILAGEGNDTINGGGGADVLVGNAGADTFVFNHTGGGAHVFDFEPGIDRMDLSGFTQTLALLEASGGLLHLAHTSGPVRDQAVDFFNQTGIYLADRNFGVELLLGVEPEYIPNNGSNIIAFLDGLSSAQIFAADFLF